LEAFTSQQQDFEPSIVDFAEPANPPVQRGGMRARDVWCNYLRKKPTIVVDPISGNHQGTVGFEKGVQ